MYGKLPVLKVQMNTRTGKQVSSGQPGRALWGPCGVAELYSMQHPKEAEGLDAAKVLEYLASLSGSKVLIYSCATFSRSCRTHAGQTHICTQSEQVNVGWNTVQHLYNGLNIYIERKKKGRPKRKCECKWESEIQNWNLRDVTLLNVA